MSNTKQKPKQKFEINFQRNIAKQLSEMKSFQLVKLLMTITSVLPLSEDMMNEYQDEFKDFLRMIGSVVREDIRTKAYLDKAPEIEELSQCLTKSNTENKYPFLFSLLSGLGGPMLNQNLAWNILESILKLVLPNYNSLIGWRNSLVIYVKTHS